MASAEDDAVLDFDLNFLRQIPNTTLEQSKIDKQRKAICLAKKKIIATNSLIQKYHAKKESLDEAEKLLAISKEECQKICIDYKNAMEKCELLEKDFKHLQIVNKELEEKTFRNENQQAAEKSYLKQLQLLVKDRDSLIKSLQKENKLLKANFRESEKKTSKENSNFIKTLKTIAESVFHKKPLHKNDKLFLCKYLENKIEENELLSDDENCVSDSDVFDDVAASPAASDEIIVQSTTEKDLVPNEAPIKNREIQLKLQLHEKKEDTDQDSDIFSEVVSLDTGRGSSLAFSDTEKCFPSPDYFMDSPVSTDTFRNPKQADSSTSPILILQSVETGTSPIIFDVEIDEGVLESSTNETDGPLHSMTCTNSRPKIVVDRAVSPIEPSSPQHTPEKELNHYDASKNITRNEINEEVTNECLHTNSSNLDVDQENDNEIEMILGTMRLSHRLVTPIPPTPARSDMSKSRSSITTDDQSSCPIAAQVRQENKILQSSISDLARELVNIKQILKTHLIKNNTSCEEFAILNEKSESSIVSVDNVFDNERRLDNIIEQFEDCHRSGDESDAYDEVPLIIIDQEKDSCDNQVQAGHEKSKRNSDKDINKDTVNIRREVHEELRVSVSPLPLSSFITFEQDGSEAITSYEETETTRAGKNTSPEIASPLKKRKGKKLSRLEKLRKNILPKSKIRKVDQPLSRKLRARLKKFPINDVKIRTVKPIHCVNDKKAFEKAVKVMAELRSKQEAKAAKATKRSIPAKTKTKYKPSVGSDKNEIKELDSSHKVTDTSEKFVSTEKNYKQTTRAQTKRLSCDKEALHTDKLSKIEEFDITIPTRSQAKGLPFDKEAFPDKQLDNPDSNSISTRTRTKRLSCDKVASPDMQFDNSHTKSLSTRSRTESLSCDKEASSNKLDNPDSNSVSTRSRTKRLSCDKEASTDKQLDNPDTNSVLTRSRTKRLSCDIEASPDKELDNPDNNSVSSRNQTKRLSCDKHTLDTAKNENKSIDLDIKKSTISTRARANRLNDTTAPPRTETVEQIRITRKSVDDKSEQSISEPSNKYKKRSKRLSADKPELPTRVLRSSVRGDSCLKIDTSNESEKVHEACSSESHHRSYGSKSEEQNASVEQVQTVISYEDLELFNSEDECPKKKRKCLENNIPGLIQNPQNSVLCKMIDKYGMTTIKNSVEKIPDTVVNSVWKKLEDGIAHVNELPPGEAKKAMNDLVADLQKLKMKQFMLGLMLYLKDPQRKIEWYNKVSAPPAPPMTKSEQVLLYLVTRLAWRAPLLPAVLDLIEHNLFKLNNTPDFSVIETMSHFYAVLCSYIKAKSRLRLFILDAMYCIHFKAIPLVRQCIEVWMHILPLAHMGTAKSPLVICLVYLLFFFKCEDKYKRVQEIRNILTKKYFFKITEWNEHKILEMLKNAIKEVNDNPIERKMLRLALILVAKRHGPRWCQNKIIQSILQPLIVQEDVPERIKLFAVSMLGPLMKPYPADMKVHCEIVMNQLIDKLNQNCSPRLRETIFSSLLTMSRHNSTRVLQALLAWQPAHVSPAFEAEMKEFVRGRPLRAWKTCLAKISLVQ